MCRNIKPLYHLAPPATDEEIRAAALQFVRKVSGFSKPSAANEAAFARAVDEVSASVRELLGELTTTAPPRNREVLAAKARARGETRQSLPQGTKSGPANKQGDQQIAR
jgi:hypothetical protein